MAVVSSRRGVWSAGATKFDLGAIAAGSLTESICTGKLGLESLFPPSRCIIESSRNSNLAIGVYDRRPTDTPLVVFPS